MCGATSVLSCDPDGNCILDSCNALSVRDEPMFCGSKFKRVMVHGKKLSICTMTANHKSCTCMVLWYRELALIFKTNDVMSPSVKQQ